MPVKIGVNGCGRIGKLLIRILEETPEFEVVAINDPMPAEIMVNLLKYDSLHGRFDLIEDFDNNHIRVKGRTIALYHETTPEKISWDNHGVECVLEASGQFRTKESLMAHLKGSTNKVILCQPAEGEIDKTIVIGVNESQLEVTDVIISNASCTTNCLAPVLKVLDDNFGVQRAFFNTVHPYTNNQALHDGPHNDLRRSRAALINIIPTTSSAVNALKPVMPHLTNHLNGFATRVPVPLGAYIEMTAQLKTKTSVEMLNQTFKKASQETMKGIIEYCTDPIVSTDIIGNKHSAIFDSLCTQIIDDDFVQILTWYDNETAYSHRVVNLLQLVYKL